MPKFRKKLVVIEAFQMTKERGDPEQRQCWPIWLHEAWERPAPATAVSRTKGGLMCISTLEGAMAVQWNDWIIQGVKGELYPCKPDIFEATYDAVEGEELCVENATGLYVDFGKPGLEARCDTCGQVVMRVTCGECQPEDKPCSPGKK